MHARDVADAEAQARQPFAIGIDRSADMICGSAIPARRQFALAGARDTMRSARVKAVLDVLRDRRLLAATRACQAGILRCP